MELDPPLEFAYSQFSIYDKSGQLNGLDWTPDHVRQGFARRASSISVRTLLEFGRAKVVVHLGASGGLERFQRVHAFPLTVTSGMVAIDGPEEYPIDRSFPVSKGHYRLVVAQVATGEIDEEIEMFLEALPLPLDFSEILIADDELNPPDPLIETAEIAG